MTTLHIIQLLLKVKEGFTLEELKNYTKMEKEELEEFLFFLEKEGIVTKTQNSYHLTHSNYFLGKVISLPRKGWLVTSEERSYPISNEDNHYKSGDFVLCQFKNKEHIQIKFHFPRNDVRIGEIKRNGKLVYIIGKADTLIPLLGNTNSLVDGSIVSYYKDGDNATLVELLCHRNDPNFLIKKVVKELRIPDEFSKEVNLEAATLPVEVSPEEILGFKDLRDKEIFTIDGDTAKDFDDAISLTQKENGNYVLGVHIAHVSYYVKDGSAMDLEARRRGTSVYMINQSIPMLPPVLSYGICSLNPGVDRLTRTCEMEFDKKGNLLQYKIYPSVIRSKKRMTYREANLVLDEKEYPPSYEPFASTLKKMYAFSLLLRENAIAHGFMNFGQNEVGFSVEENNEVLNVFPIIRGKAEKMIEMFMLEANQTVAREMTEKNYQILYRIHPTPDIKALNDALSSLGMQPFTEDYIIENKDIQNILETLSQDENFSIYARVILQSFKKARYAPMNYGHFGIGATHYTHFTSPIRRYPDLFLHRVLDRYDYEKENPKKSLKEFAYLEILGNQLSNFERRADLAEAEVDKQYSALYLSKHVGEKFTGKICMISSKGIHIQLQNLIEGSIKDLKKFRLIRPGEAFIETKKIRKNVYLGDTVEVYLTVADAHQREINFSFDKPKIKVKK